VNPGAALEVLLPSGLEVRGSSSVLLDVNFGGRAALFLASPAERSIHLIRRCYYGLVRNSSTPVFVGLERLGYDAESQRKSSLFVRSRKSAFGIFIRFDGRHSRSSGLIKK
jgi:hypothetical protein